jgi:hypothetical protein
MAVDEIAFHRRRILPVWERWGHPLDTLSLLFCLGLALALPPDRLWTGLYLVLAVFSCLLVAKDEWVHARHCAPGEHFVHALLFLLHPVLLWSVFTLWRAGGGPANLLLGAEAALASAFFFYQVLGSLPWRRLPA